MASVADLVEPSTLEGSVDPAVWRAGQAMRGVVSFSGFGPLWVQADVADEADGTTHRVRLSAVEDRLEWSCDCSAASGGDQCAHFVAAALETWVRAPNRQG